MLHSVSLLRFRSSRITSGTPGTSLSRLRASSTSTPGAASITAMISRRRAAFWSLCKIRQSWDMPT